MEARANPESHERAAEWTSGSDNCVDQSRMTFCLIEGKQAAARGQAAWLSARVQAHARIDSVHLLIFRPWGGLAVAPYEVWAGDTFGDARQQCSLRHGGETEPSHGGIPAIADCHGARHSFVTIRQLGSPRRWQLSELEVYAHAPAPLADDSSQRGPADGEVAREIAERFEVGRPSNILAEAGVLVVSHRRLELGPLVKRCPARQRVTE